MRLISLYKFVPSLLVYLSAVLYEIFSLKIPDVFGGRLVIHTVYQKRNKGVVHYAKLVQEKLYDADEKKLVTERDGISVGNTRKHVKRARWRIGGGR